MRLAGGPFVLGATRSAKPNQYQSSRGCTREKSGGDVVKLIDNGPPRESHLFTTPSNYLSITEKMPGAGIDCKLLMLMDYIHSECLIEQADSDQIKA
jgi:hypothetical protein